MGIEHDHPGSLGKASETFASNWLETRQVCDQIGKEMADVALAWLLHQPAVACVLAGASRPDQIKQNVEAARIELSPDALKQLDDATNEVKQKLGPNVDPWQTASRIK